MNKDIWERHPYLTTAAFLSYFIVLPVVLICVDTEDSLWRVLYIPIAVWGAPFLIWGLTCTAAMPFLAIHLYITTSDRLKLWRWCRLFPRLRKARWFRLPIQPEFLRDELHKAVPIPAWLIPTMPWHERGCVTYKHGDSDAGALEYIDCVLKNSQMENYRHGLLVRTRSRIYIFAEYFESTEYRADELHQHVWQRRSHGWRRWLLIWVLKYRLRRAQCGRESAAIRDVLDRLGAVG